MPVLLPTTITMGVGSVSPVFVGRIRVGLAHLRAAFFPWLVLTLLSYGALTQVIKTCYPRGFQIWL